jgi:hypothetical protein
VTPFPVPLSGTQGLSRQGSTWIDQESLNAVDDALRFWGPNTTTRAQRTFLVSMNDNPIAFRDRLGRIGLIWMGTTIVLWPIVIFISFFIIDCLGRRREGIGRKVLLLGCYIDMCLGEGGDEVDLDLDGEWFNSFCCGICPITSSSSSSSTSTMFDESDSSSSLSSGLVNQDFHSMTTVIVSSGWLSIHFLYCHFAFLLNFSLRV